MVRFEWDEKNNQSNCVKHGIHSKPQLIFDDPGCVTFIERTIDGEPRWHAIVHPHRLGTPSDSSRKEAL